MFDQPTITSSYSLNPSTYYTQTSHFSINQFLTHQQFTQPINQLLSQFLNQLINQPINQSNNPYPISSYSTNHSINQLLNQPINYLLNKSFRQKSFYHINPSAWWTIQINYNTLLNQLLNQSTISLTNQPINHSITHVWSTNQTSILNI